jgi:hypothetical protein
MHIVTPAAIAAQREGTAICARIAFFDRPGFADLRARFKRAEMRRSEIFRSF